jgi:hypothetical protein
MNYDEISHIKIAQGLSQSNLGGLIPLDIPNFVKLDVV